MPAEPPHRHNGGPLSDDMAGKLWGHVRALEALDEQAQEIRDDQKARKELAKADGFDNNILTAIIKRRKVGQGETLAADHMVRLYEEALQDQGALPLEQTRITPAPTRKPLEQIARELHGQDLPPSEREDDAIAAARSLDETCRRNGTTATLSVNGEEVATFGGRRSAMFD